MTAAAPPVLHDFDARPLGVAASDLGLELSDPVSPAAVTQVLLAGLRDSAGRAPALGVLQSAPVGDRVAALMAIAALTGGGTLSIAVQCPAQACRDELELEITWDEIRAVAATTADGPFEVDADGLRYVMRRPTALDQEAWVIALSRGDQLDAGTVVSRLVVDGPLDRLTDARVAALEAALNEHDPLVTFEVSVVCSTCGVTTPRELSLVAVGAAVLRAQQAALLDDIHYLAHAYGWSEAAILAIPAWRREAYRSRIAGGR
jgi:hypothetical protein